MQGFHLANLGPPSHVPSARYKVISKGLISKYWSIVNNSQEAFRASTSPSRVELRHALSDLFASASMVSNKMSYPPLLLPNVLPFLATQTNELAAFNLQPAKEEFPQNDPNSFHLQLNLEHPISIKRGVQNRISVGASNEPPSILLIKDVPGYYLWRTWQISDERFPSKPIVQFIWFGTNPSNQVVGSIEVFSPLPDIFTASLLIVILSFFNESSKSEPKQRKISTLFKIAREKKPLPSFSEEPREYSFKVVKKI